MTPRLDHRPDPVALTWCRDCQQYLDGRECSVRLRAALDKRTRAEQLARNLGGRFSPGGEE